jgi:hypothetical protein
MYVNKVTKSSNENVIWKSEATKTGFGCVYGPTISKRLRFVAKATGLSCVKRTSSHRYVNRNTNSKTAARARLLQLKRPQNRGSLRDLFSSKY